jgi:outer membrane protein
MHSPWWLTFVNRHCGVLKESTTQTKVIIMKRLIIIVATALLLTVSFQSQAHEDGQWILRGGVGVVDPKSGNLNLGSLDLGGGISLTSASIEVDSATSLTLSGTYMITENWAFDILASWPFKHDIDVAATISDGVDTVSGKVGIAEVEHLPPTFSLQYHFIPDGNFQPYVGAGVNWTTFFSEKVSSDASDLGIVSLQLDDSIGFAAQVGADWLMGDRWLVNLDLRWINIETDVTGTLDVGTGPETGELGTVKIDPLVYSLNIGYRF